MLLTGDPFALYQATWWSSIGCGVLFLLLVWWKVRQWNFYGQWALLSFFAAGAFSFTQVPDATSSAPAAIAFILELENEGAAGEIAMLSHIAIVWVCLFLLAVITRVVWHQYFNQNSSGETSANHQHQTQDPKLPEDNR